MNCPRRMAFCDQAIGEDCYPGTWTDTGTAGALDCFAQKIAPFHLQMKSVRRANHEIVPAREGNDTFLLPCYRCPFADIEATTDDRASRSSNKTTTDQRRYQPSRRNKLLLQWPRKSGIDKSTWNRAKTHACLFLCPWTADAKSSALAHFQRREKRNQIAQFFGSEVSIQTLRHDGNGAGKNLFDLVARQSSFRTARGQQSDFLGGFAADNAGKRLSRNDDRDRFVTTGNRSARKGDRFQKIAAVRISPICDKSGPTLEPFLFTR